MKPQRLCIVEQYLSWDGHYKKYFENLISNKYFFLYIATDEGKYQNSIYKPSFYKNKSNFINFVLGRLIDSFRAYDVAINAQFGIIHLIEFEPVSFLYYMVFKSDKIPQLIITIHSVDRMTYNSFLKNTVSAVQRGIYRYVLKKLANNNTCFVTHYKHHKNQLLAVIGTHHSNKVKVINYPCPERSNEPSLYCGGRSNRLLIYGQIREDKGVFEFLSQPEATNLTITLAGKIMDPRILKMNLPNLTIINRFIPDSELGEIMTSHDFMLLPYPQSYTGGAGTLKDSLAFGLPILASNIPIFREVIEEGNVGLIFTNVSDILSFSENISLEDYNNLVLNCFKYAKTNNWASMRREYFKLYDQSLDSLPNEVVCE